MNAALQQIFKKTIEEKVDEWFPLPKGDEALPELTDNILNKCVKLLVILSLYLLIKIKVFNIQSLIGWRLRFTNFEVNLSVKSLNYADLSNVILKVENQLSSA